MPGNSAGMPDFTKRSLQTKLIRLFKIGAQPAGASTGSGRSAGSKGSPCAAQREFAWDLAGVLCISLAVMTLVAWWIPDLAGAVCCSPGCSSPAVVWLGHHLDDYDAGNPGDGYDAPRADWHFGTGILAEGAGAGSGGDHSLALLADWVADLCLGLTRVWMAGRVGWSLAEMLRIACR